jgi:hemerythrin
MREGNTLAVNLEMNKTVVGWLKAHILIHDREFSKYYNALEKKPF